MSKFEKYHPVLTANYTLDWLTQTPVKQIFDLYQGATFETSLTVQRPKAIIDTVKNVNQTMQKVMSEQELTWGITDSNSGDFLGIIKAFHLKEPNEGAQISFITKIHQPETLLLQVVQRTVKFIIDHFDSTRVKINLAKDNQQVVKTIETLGFVSLGNGDYSLELTPELRANFELNM
ncbi:GNAT family N-acetyltransferase [Lentilactobacillus sp. SPB1-3]|uniref:GNAT family N-acetyltransferase n=1 Tax=Lentilactobacillus terminaliae TaxID=3003483 RepID=A0ACD5DF59_9LACO|nr:GNAT family N-acetyltransferase [Lentilactobacillus sp. SPB1-3]MCZ0976537.1 GNAT family N-acetyltransferase [Lentilactobacillus sp. SPB1-3]